MKKRRFQTEASIITAIDRCYAHAERLSKEADGREDLAKRLIKDADIQEDLTIGERASMRNEASRELVTAEKRRLRAKWYLESKARLLGRKLSEFRTDLLTGCGTDRSIPQ